MPLVKSALSGVVAVEILHEHKSDFKNVSSMVSWYKQSS